MLPPSWSDERIELLCKLVPKGHSYSIIAVEISQLAGPPVSRNACIGKATRLGIAHPRAGHATLSRAQRTARKRVRVPGARRIAPTSEQMTLAQMQREAVRAEPDSITPPDQRCTLDALTEAACRFPYGHGTADDPFRFCAKPRVPGKPYCLGHCMRAFDVPQPRRRDFIVAEPAAAVVRQTEDTVAA